MEHDASNHVSLICPDCLAGISSSMLLRSLTCCMAFAMPSSIPLQRRARLHSVSGNVMMSNSFDPPKSTQVVTSRRVALQLVALTAVSTVTPAIGAPPVQNLTPEEAILPVAMCVHVLSPVERYVNEGEWDKARTNINYCTRILALRKKMQAATGTLVGDGFYDGTEIAGEILDTFTQLDTSVYTPIFIASDDGVSVEQRKYQKEALEYLGEAYGYLNRFLALFPEKSVRSAHEKAKNSSLYEIKIDEP